MGSAFAKVICMFSAKGGTGRTTIASNLAVALGEQDLSTVLLDLDLHDGGIDQVLGLESDRTIGDLIANKDFDGIDGYLTGFNDKVKVLTAPTRPQAGLNLDSMEVLEVLDALRPKFDFIIVDLPSDISGHVSGVLEEADLIALLTGNDPLSIKSAVFVLQNLALLGFDLQVVRLVINKYDPAGMRADEVDEAIGLPVFWRIDIDRDVFDSVNKSRPFVLNKPRAGASYALRRMALALSMEFNKKRTR